MQIFEMDARNFRFLGHPNAWVVHRPHAPSSGYNHTFTGEAYTQVRQGSLGLGRDWYCKQTRQHMGAEAQLCRSN